MMLPVRNESQRSAEYPEGRRGALCLLWQKECAPIGEQLVSLIFRWHFFHGITPWSPSSKASTTSLVLAPVYRPSYYSLLHLIKHDNNSQTTEAIFNATSIHKSAQSLSTRLCGAWLCRLTDRPDDFSLALTVPTLGPTLDFANPWLQDPTVRCATQTRTLSSMSCRSDARGTVLPSLTGVDYSKEEGKGLEYWLGQFRSACCQVTHGSSGTRLFITYNIDQDNVSRQATMFGIPRYAPESICGAGVKVLHATTYKTWTDYSTKTAKNSPVRNSLVRDVLVSQLSRM